MRTIKIAIASTVKVAHCGCISVSHIRPLKSRSSDKMPRICFSVFTLTLQSVSTPPRRAALRAKDESGIDLRISLLALRQKKKKVVAGPGLMELEVTEVLGGGRGMTISLQLLGMPEPGLSSSLQPWWPLSCSWPCAGKRGGFFLPHHTHWLSGRIVSRIEQFCAVTPLWRHRESTSFPASPHV